MNDSKIINDPVFGFIKIPRGLLYNIVSHPLMQRLNRINQLGLASVVYPGARHTRFQHSLGAFHLMSEAVLSLQQKGNFIFDSEAEAVQAAILMHDIGHGPFSHVLENTLIHGISHEDISLMMMEQINRDLGGGLLNLAISIFKDEYGKKFLHQLISSQLDMDRLDYLRRDSFFTGVTEGNIGSARIIKMLNVVDDSLVVESKGIYSLENYLTTRRLMYWQVYLHKTAVAYEKVLVNTLTRAKDLTRQGHEVFAPPSLLYFLKNDVDAAWFTHHDEALQMYGELDDNDIWSAMKVWRHADDKILAVFILAEVTLLVTLVIYLIAFLDLDRRVDDGNKADAAGFEIIAELFEIREPFGADGKVFEPIHIVDVEVDHVDRDPCLLIAVGAAADILLGHVSPAALTVAERPLRGHIAFADQRAEFSDDGFERIAGDDVQLQREALRRDGQHVAVGVADIEGDL